MGGDERERREWAVPKREGRFRGFELDHLDPDDPDDRRLLILAEHPELAAAIDRGEDEVLVGGQPMNPELHITIHEVLAAQLWDGEPPEVWDTAKRLWDRGYERHEILHMLAGTIADQTFRMLRDHVPYDRDEHLRALDALPGSWEATRPG